MNDRTEILKTFQAIHAGFKKGLEATGNTEALSAMDERFETLYDAIESGEDYIYPAQDAIASLFTMHPNLTPVIPRKLLWQLGGSCLHYLTDEEISQFTAEDEQRHIRH